PAALLSSSSSLLLSLLLAQLPVFTSAFTTPRPFDKLSDKTRNLMRLTQELLVREKHAIYPDVFQHRFQSLPEMSNRSANDLSNLELKSTLSQLHADLKMYKQHFEWLSNVLKKHHRPAAEKELVAIIEEVKSLLSMLERQMLTAEAPRLTQATPSFSTHPTSHFDVLKSSKALLKHFKFYCDWASRAFISLNQP
uniref:Interleukin 11a n=1 Tax=Gouania willdenowi TaxID=441366 RepID=A0A8C5DRW7_GOUWI